MKIGSIIESFRTVHTLHGEFSFIDYPEFRKTHQATTFTKNRPIIFDIRNLKSIDFAAIGMMLLFAEDAKGSDCQVVLSNAEGLVKNTLRAISANKFFTVDF